MVQEEQELQTAGLAFAGNLSCNYKRLTSAEEYNGSGWSTGGNL
jgi:hypothetical protein